MTDTYEDLTNEERAALGSDPEIAGLRAEVLRARRGELEAMRAHAAYMERDLERPSKPKPALDVAGQFDLSGYLQRAATLAATHADVARWAAETETLTPTMREQHILDNENRRAAAMRALEAEARAAIDAEAAAILEARRELERVQVGELRKVASRVTEFERAALVARLRAMTPPQVSAWARSETDPAVRLVLQVDGPGAVRGLPEGEGAGVLGSWAGVASELESMPVDPRELVLQERAARLREARRRVDTLDPEKHEAQLVQAFDIRPAM